MIIDGVVGLRGRTLRALIVILERMAVSLYTSLNLPFPIPPVLLVPPDSSLYWKEVVNFGSPRSVTDSSDELQIARRRAIDYLSVYGIDYTDMPFLCYHGSELRNKGM